MKLSILSNKKIQKFNLIFANVIIFTLLSKNMGNSQFQIPERVRREWSESLANDKRLFQNKLTQESFYFLVFTQLESKLTFPELIQRSIYPIPKTPKIIILNDKQGQISFLVQRKTHTLKAILTALFLQLQLYQTIKEIISTIYKLYKRYGPFGINENMIGGSNQKEIIVWINETYEQSSPSNKLAQSNFAEQAMLLQLLEIIKSNIQSDLLNDVLVYTQSFQKIISLLNSKIQKEKSTLYKRKELESNRKVPSIRYFSPRNTFNNNKKIIREEQTERNQENKKKYNIPNFIKGFKDKKLAFENQQKQKKKESHALLKKQKQFLNYSCKFLRKANKADNLTNVSFSKLRTFNVSPPSKSKHHKNQKQHHESGSTNFSTISKNFSSQNYEKLTFSKKSNQQCIQKRNTHPTEKQFNPQSAKRFQHKQKCRKQLSQIDDETLKKTTKKDYSKLSYGLNTLCKALNESQQLNDTMQIILSQKQSQPKGNQQYKVVVHDQLHYSMSFQQPTNMIEQFSRIIY